MPKQDNEAPSTEAPMPPMGDASSVDPNMGADPMMPPTDGQNIGAGDGMEPAGEPMPDMGGEPEGGEGSGDDTMSLFDELSDEDKEAARKYIESMLTRDESQEGTDMGNEMPDMGGAPQMPMESVIFTKGQLKKINESLGAGMDDEKDDKKLTQRTEKTNSKVKSSPFNSPRFK